jgi:hypothetical protein
VAQWQLAMKMKMAKAAIMAINGISNEISISISIRSGINENMKKSSKREMSASKIEEM